MYTGMRQFAVITHLAGMLAFSVPCFAQEIMQGEHISVVPFFFDELNVSACIIIGISAMVVGFLVLIRNHYFRMKRLFDVAGSIIAISLLFPVVLVAAILVKLDSHGPIFIKQVRVGVNRRMPKPKTALPSDRRREDNYGALFTIYKLRTMRSDAEAKTGPIWARQNDARITRVGKVLRKTRIDEIPQFLNVLKGDMCIIGPRPERPLFIGQLSHHIQGYTKRLKVKPGITGLAQVRYCYTSSIEDTRKKLKYDLLYIRKMGFVLDMNILLNTFTTIVFAKGAR
jgi:lipopolysaccharide/colanic/teichoic acid biosynthesis glycosyltransferase